MKDRRVARFCPMFGQNYPYMEKRSDRLIGNSFGSGMPNGSKTLALPSPISVLEHGYGEVLGTLRNML